MYGEPSSLAMLDLTFAAFLQDSLHAFRTFGTVLCFRTSVLSYLSYLRVKYWHYLEVLSDLSLKPSVVANIPLAAYFGNKWVNTKCGIPESGC